LADTIPQKFKVAFNLFFKPVTVASLGDFIIVRL
jgi:hypothetical protein